MAFPVGAALLQFMAVQQMDSYFRFTKTFSLSLLMEKSYTQKLANRMKPFSF